LERRRGFYRQRRCRSAGNQNHQRGNRSKKTPPYRQAFPKGRDEVSPRAQIPVQRQKTESDRYLQQSRCHRMPTRKALQMCRLREDGLLLRQAFVESTPLK
jgi:hypothetical protein